MAREDEEHKGVACYAWVWPRHAGEENETSWATGLAAGFGRLCSWAYFCLLGPAEVGWLQLQKTRLILGLNTTKRASNGP